MPSLDNQGQESADAKSMPKACGTSLLDGSLQGHSALIDAVLRDDLAVMEHVELFSGILASKHHDGLLPARVLT